MSVMTLAWLLYFLILIIAIMIKINRRYKNGKTLLSENLHQTNRSLAKNHRSKQVSVQEIISEAELVPGNTKNGAKILKTLLRWVLILTFLFFAIWGQINFLEYPDGEQEGIYCYGAAIFLFILLTLIYREKDTPEPTDSQSPSPSQSSFSISAVKQAVHNHPKKTILLGLSLLFAVVSVILLINRSPKNTYWDIFFLWIASFSAYAFVFINPVKFSLKYYFKEHKIDIILILVFTVLGGIFRFYGLGNIPNIIDGDEGRFGLVITDILEGHTTNMFRTIYGNSSLYFFFIAGMMKLFGKSVAILRIGSAIGGTLTIPFLYLMAKNLFNRRTAITATVILIVSNFHIHFSHIMSVTSIQDAFFATVSLYLFYTGIKNRSANRITLAGLVLGFAIYVYMGARLIILMLPIYILLMLVLHPNVIKQNLGNLLIFWGALLIISVPMIYWAISNPDAFNIRVNQVGIIQSGWLAKEASITGQTQLQIFLNAVKQSFLTTIFYPSKDFHNSSWPMLDLISSILFMAGLTFSLVNTKDSRYLLLNGWFWSGILVGGALVILPSTNSYRILIVFPAMCLLSGIGFDRLINFMEGQSNFSKSFFQLITVSILIFISIFNLRAYFVTYAPLCKYEELNTRSASYLGSYASTLDPDVEIYLLTAPQLRSYTHPSLSYLSPGRAFTEFVNPLTAPPENLDHHTRYAFFFSPPRLNELQLIEKEFPGGTVGKLYDCQNVILIFYLWNP